MRNLRGFLVAGVFGCLTWLLTWAAEQYKDLLFLAYPFLSRTVQDFLAEFTARFDFCLWQAALLAAIIAMLTTLILVILLHKNVLRWAGAWTAAASIAAFLFMGMWGLNYYNPHSLLESMGIEEQKFSLRELQDATEYYRDMANRYSKVQRRDSQGHLKMPGFDTLAGQAGEGYDTLLYRCSAFAGVRTPVKELGFSELYSRMGFDGVTVALTGEAAVSTDCYGGMLPVAMCHEMAHRMAIAQEDEANFAAILASTTNSSLEFKYSGYLCAYIYCYNALYQADPQAAAQVAKGVSVELRRDLDDNNDNVHRNDGPVKDSAQQAYDSYQKTLGQDKGILTYDGVYNQLVNWYLWEVVRDDTPQVPQFDPYQVEY